MTDPDMPMRRINLTFRDSRYNYATQCNGTRASICRYFNTPLSLVPEDDDHGDGEAVLIRPTGITFVDQNIHVPFSPGDDQNAS